MSDTFAPPRITTTTAPDGSLILTSDDRLLDPPGTVLDSFRAGATAHPDRLLVAERTPSRDDWIRLNWGDALASAQMFGRGLVAGGHAGKPVMILSNNSVAHLVVTLGAYFAASPVVPVSVAYSLQSADHAKLRALVAAAQPSVIFAESPDYRPALDAVADGRTVVTAATLAEFSDADAELPDPPMLDAVAKIMFTSGSTGHPKGVINTHRMLATNQQQMRQVWPFLADEPPVLLDWLPWSHTFGGNHDMNMVLTNGGSLWIDDGRPAPALIDRTAENVTDARPTVCFNVPAGYGALVPVLQRDDDAAKAFFANLRLVFYAAAALPQSTWDAVEELASKHGGRAQMTTSWGMTETSPAATTTHFPTSSADSIGVPLPGLEAKLAPVGEKLELRVRGPNVTPGFHGRPELRETAFDDDGFLRTGDACRLVDPDDPARGLAFDGRIAEDFKLSTGTFVSVGTLRPAFLSACGGLVSDAVICGHDTDSVKALVWLHPDHGSRHTAGVPDDGLRTDLVAALNRFADGAGSSQRVERLLILTEPATLDRGELTDKGYVNQAKVRELRAGLVAEVSAAVASTRVIVRA